VPFLADDFGAWLVGLFADAARRKLITLALGTEQQRALHSVARDAIQLTAVELRSDGQEAEHVARVLSQVFSEPVPAAPTAKYATMLEELRDGIIRQLAVLDDVSLTGTPRSSADILGVTTEVLAQNLTAHVLREIMVRGSRGGPLEPLSNHGVCKVRDWLSA
jgi:hypothetical protein